MKITSSILWALVLLPTAVSAQQTGGDLGLNSYAEIASADPGPFSVMVVPDGSGTPLTAAMLPGGAHTDATLMVYLIDDLGDPVAGFPFEDMWLEAMDAGLVSCPGGTVADSDTDADGSATWTTPLYAGGSSTAGCQITIYALGRLPLPVFPIQFNSPDLNGDGLVNLTDVAAFVGDFQAGYNYRSDFAFDGVLNLSDVVLMVPAIGGSCP